MNDSRMEAPAKPGERALGDLVVDQDGRVRDRLGRIQPSRLNWLKLIRAIPQLISGRNRAFRRRVPESFFTNDVGEDGKPLVVVSCPCGAEPQVPVGGCGECECERFYLATSQAVLVANSPQDRENDEDTEEANGRRTS